MDSFMNRITKDIHRAPPQIDIIAYLSSSNILVNSQIIFKKKIS